MLDRSTSHTPPVLRSRPDAIRSSVLLPHPDGPTTVTNSPGLTVNDVRSSACVPSGNVIETFLKVSAGSPVVSRGDEPAAAVSTIGREPYRRAFGRSGRVA